MTDSGFVPMSWWVLLQCLKDQDITRDNRIIFWNIMECEVSLQVPCGLYVMFVESLENFIIVIWKGNDRWRISATILVKFIDAMFVGSQQNIVTSIWKRKHGYKSMQMLFWLYEQCL